MLERFNGFLWGVPVLGLILGTGIWLTGVTGFVQVRLFPAAYREFWKRLKNRDSGLTIVKNPIIVERRKGWEKEE